MNSKTKLSGKRRVFEKWGEEGVMATFSLLPENATSFEQENIHTVMIDSNQNLMKQVSQIGLELNGSTKSLHPGYTASHAFLRTVTVSNKENPGKEIITINRLPGFVYFGRLVVSSSSFFVTNGHLHMMVLPRHTGVHADNWVSIQSRAGATFDLTTADIVIAAGFPPALSKQGQTIYLKGRRFDRPVSLQLKERTVAPF